MSIPENEEQEVLNPQIETIKIGTRQLRNIHIYPLSMADQMSMSDLVTKMVQSFTLHKDKTDIEFVKSLCEEVKGKLDVLLKYITDIDEDQAPGSLLSEITNEQAIDLVKLVYHMNYENLVKNVVDLLKKAEISSLLGRSLPVFSEIIASSDSKTSTETVGEKEA